MRRTRYTRFVSPHAFRRDGVIAWVLALGALSGGCARRQVTVSLVPPLIPSPKPFVLWLEPFDELHPARWREVEVRGTTQYQAVDLAGRHCLKAYSHGGASILLNTTRFRPQLYPWLSWQWRVDQFVDGEGLDRKEGSDASARVYVYFDTKGLPWQKRSLDYVWSASLPVGTILSSAYSQASKIIVVDSGPSPVGQWRTVERNLLDDYQRCFGDTPPDVISIGLMTDTDNTGHEALAYFDEVRVSRSTPRAVGPDSGR